MIDEPKGLDAIARRGKIDRARTLDLRFADALRRLSEAAAVAAESWRRMAAGLPKIAQNHAHASSVTRQPHIPPKP
jgi:hypothetical protein